MDDMLDAENKLLADNLATKVSRLKSVCAKVDVCVCNDRVSLGITCFI